MYDQVGDRELTCFGKEVGTAPSGSWYMDQCMVFVDVEIIHRVGSAFRVVNLTNPGLSKVVLTAWVNSFCRSRFNVPESVELQCPAEWLTSGLHPPFQKGEACTSMTQRLSCLVSLETCIDRYTCKWHRDSLSYIQIHKKIKTADCQRGIETVSSSLK